MRDDNQKVLARVIIATSCGHLNSGEISLPDQVVPRSPGQPMSLSFKPGPVLLPPCPHSPPSSLPNYFPNQYHALKQAADIGPDHRSGQAPPQVTCHLPQFTGSLQGTLPQAHAPQPALSKVVQPLLHPIRHLSISPKAQVGHRRETAQPTECRSSVISKAQLTVNLEGLYSPAS